MRPIPFVLLSGLFLAACSLTQLPTIQPNQTYKGYPCFTACVDFTAGYDQATKVKFAEKSQCANLEVKQQLGCQAYLNDLSSQAPGNRDLFLKP